MFSRFRSQDLGLSSFTNVEKKRITRFQEFINMKPDGFCCICMKILYPEEKRYRTYFSPHNLPCHEWQLEPLIKEDTTNMYMVCASHVKTIESDITHFVYPGTLV